MSEFNKTNILGYIMIVFIGIIIVKIYFESDSFNLKCIISTVDGNKYCVRESAKLQLVADLLAKTTQKLKKGCRIFRRDLSRKRKCKENG